ncbi:hypothetical protein CASFOL_013717 [Castilleja foliolosa]|uniref:C2 NT-type domain-containing protein n=1 Tax=Castilleja foliolosa TaxID=1961234 RepID=A0ABD3DNQ3_9LAMI
MMLSKQDSRKKASVTSSNGKFLSDLETMSSAFYSDKPLSRLASSTASSRSKSVRKPLVPPDTNKKKSTDAKNNNTKLSSDKDIKKSSIWSWKGLKALTHVRNHRFNCCFSLSVHSIVGLPVFFNDSCLVVHWKSRDGEKTTRPISVSHGVAEFEEQLTQSCSVYGSRSGSQNSAKYEAKHFMLYVSVYDAPELDLGKHRIDLTRLLPVKLEELEDKKSSGKWTTSFRLSGKARGATINVSFGYVVIDDNDNINNSSETSCEKNAASGSISSQQKSERTIAMISEDVKDLHEVLPMPTSELCDSVNILYQKLDQEMIDNNSVENEFPADSLSSPSDPRRLELFMPPVAGEYTNGTEREMAEFSVIDKGIIELSKENAKQGDESFDNVKQEDESFENAKEEDESFENAQVHSFGDGVEAGIADNVALDEEASPLAPSAPQNDEQSVNTSNYESQEYEMCSKESILKELEAALNYTSGLVNEEVDSEEDETGDAINPESDLEIRRKGKSLILDDETELVARDFLGMLGIEEGNNCQMNLSSESEPESPRERLLREFEQDALANGGLLNFDIDYDPSMFEDFGDMSNIETDNAFGDNKTRALRMEDLETEALMREWGLNEKAFQQSPSSSGGAGFASPMDDILPEEPQLLPPLAEGLGSFVQTKNGGFVRSMNPLLFQNAKNGGSLIMQVSNPVVVPAELGSGVMDILQGLASVGIEKLSMQANKLMPLEDVTEKTIQQIAWESAQSLEGPERQDLPALESEILRDMRSGQKCEEKGIPHVGHVPKSNKFNSSSLSSDTEYVNLEDLAPLAMDKIEALSIEGLRIQSGMSDANVPSNISAQSIGEFSALKGKTVDVGGSIGLDGTCGLQLLDIKDNGPPEEDVDGLMGLSLTLDEWMKLDSGEIDEEELVSERTSKILAAHRATSLDVFRGRSKGEKRRGRGKKYGLLGNNFTVALMVQLRDPLRNYEAVGVPMLALIQVERVFVPPKPRIYGTVSMVRGSNEDDENEDVAEKTKKDEKIHEVQEEVINIPQYKITEVRVAGLKTEEEGKKKLWGTSNQQQSGSRWLLANGMGKKNNINNKNQLMKSKAVGKSSLWSINGKGR